MRVLIPQIEKGTGQLGDLNSRIERENQARFVIKIIHPEIVKAVKIKVA